MQNKNPSVWIRKDYTGSAGYSKGTLRYLIKKVLTSYLTDQNELFLWTLTEDLVEAVYYKAPVNREEDEFETYIFNREGLHNTTSQPSSDSSWTDVCWNGMFLQIQGPFCPYGGLWDEKGCEMDYRVIEIDGVDHIFTRTPLNSEQISRMETSDEYADFLYENNLEFDCSGSRIQQLLEDKFFDPYIRLVQYKNTAEKIWTDSLKHLVRVNQPLLQITEYLPDLEYLIKEPDDEDI